MKNLVNDALSCAGVLSVLIGLATGCGGASTAQGSEPAKTTAAPASSGGAAPAGSASAGGPAPEQINAVLKEHTRELKACYDREKDRGMAYKGDTKFRVKVAPDGKVTDVQGVDIPPAGEFLSSCVSESMKGWKFPSSGQGGSMTFAVPW
jgi:outer membrane biosynthesis protein TonB